MIGTLAIGYGVAGIVLAVALSVVRRPTASDAILIALVWPLYVPFWLTTTDRRDSRLVDALERAGKSPLGRLLPDGDSARLLATRLDEANARLADLDALLARPDFEPSAIERRAQELAARGATAAAATTQLRIRTVAQLRNLRERYRHELDEINELIAQLIASAELVRLDPARGAASGELVRELVAQIEGLEELAAMEYPADPGRSLSS